MRADGRCSCGNYTESSSGLCPACINRQTTLYSTSVLPGAPSSEPPTPLIAQVKLSTGRMYLDVAGVAVAMEGDPCRDPELPENVWSGPLLRQAAARINQQGSPVAEATIQQIREYVGVVKAQAADAADAAKDARQRREVGTANYYEGKEEAYDDCATEIAALLVAPMGGRDTMTCDECHGAGCEVCHDLGWVRPLRQERCILNLDSPSYPPTIDEYRQCAKQGCSMCAAKVRDGRFLRSP